MALLTVATGLRAQTTTKTAYVVYDNETLYFLSDENDNLSTITIEEKEIILNTSGTDRNCWKGTEVTNSSITSSPDWHSKCQDVKKVVFYPSFANILPVSCHKWFNEFSILEKIDGIDNLYTSSVTNMGYMFRGCVKLNALALSANFITSSVEDMSYMFSGCNKLNKLDLQHFNTENVTNMSYMFNGCSGLTSLNLSNFNTKKVENMKYMFYECWKLTQLTFCSTFTVEDVENMSYMFYNCSGLKVLDLTNFRTSSAKDMSYMFYGCSGLTSLKISNFNTENVTNMSCMFYGCKGLTSLEISNFKTGNVTTMNGMFDGSNKLMSLDLSNFNTENVTNISYLFYGCSALTSLDLRNFNTTKVTNLGAMFAGCKKLRLLDLSKATGIVSDVINKLSKEIRPLIYIKSDSDIPTTSDKINIIVNGKCEHLVIDYDDTNADQLLLSVPYKFTAEKITINRDFVAGNPHTLYLPFTMDADAKTYGTFYTYGGYDNGTVTFNELTDATTTVNTPYLFKPKKSGTIVIDGSITVEPNTTQGEAQIDNETNNETDADANGRFIGVYEKKTFTKDEADAGIYYGWANGKFKRAGEAASVDACRAYLKLPERQAGRAPASLSVKFDGDGTTGIGAAKIGADGSTEVPVYNLQGQRVGADYKGMVIKNGRKVIVK